MAAGGRPAVAHGRQLTGMLTIITHILNAPVIERIVGHLGLQAQSAEGRYPCKNAIPQGHSIVHHAGPFHDHFTFAAKRLVFAALGSILCAFRTCG